MLTQNRDSGSRICLAGADCSLGHEYHAHNSQAGKPQNRMVLLVPAVPAKGCTSARDVSRLMGHKSIINQMSYLSWSVPNL